MTLQLKTNEKLSILTNKNNLNTFKLLFASNLSKVDVQVDYISDNNEKSNNKLWKLPRVVFPDGTTINSTAAALEYIFVKNDDDDDDYSKWLEWDMTQLQPCIVSYFHPGVSDVSVHKTRLWDLLKEFNKYLDSSKSSASQAKYCICTTLWFTLFDSNVAKDIRHDFPAIDDLIKTVTNLETFKALLKDYPMEQGVKSVDSLQSGFNFFLNAYNNAKVAKEMTDTNEKIVFNDEHLKSIKDNWLSLEKKLVMDKPDYPILPKEGEKNILITSALPYVNNVPHLGNIIGCVLSADIFARYCRQKNYNTLFICGTDEYGTATEAKAFQEKMTPQEVCDKYFDIHNDIYRWFSIGFDYFGRTTIPEQTQIVQDLFLTVRTQGYIFDQTVDQLLCEHCQRFLADRFVEGTCPGCKYPDARGDQCDGCGHLVNTTELINPRCKVCNNTPIIKPSTQFFLDLPKIENELRKWAFEAEKNWSSVARAVAKPWLRDGLKPRCITRDLKWGIPVPLDGFRDKVFYVWFDAPLGYISITKRYTKHYEQWWQPKSNVNVDLYQFMAKDNVPFHSIMFPASLLAANQGHLLVKSIMASEYLNYEDTKFSKSRGIGVFGNDARDTGIPSDIWRFYLAYIRPESQDSNFNWMDLASKHNNELLSNLGNFINRGLTFAEKNFNSKVPDINLQEDDIYLLALVQHELTQYNLSLEQAKLRDSLRCILSISRIGNQYMQSKQPWVTIKGSPEDKIKAATVIGLCCNLTYLLSSLIAPFMPNISREIRGQLGLDVTEYGSIPDKVYQFLEPGWKINKPSPLFTKIEEDQIKVLKSKYGGVQNDSNDASKNVEKLVVTSTNNADSVEALEAAIAKQGQLVRELKSKGDKSVWQPQVQILLNLKKKLADLTINSDKSINSAKINETKSKNKKK